MTQIIGTNYQSTIPTLSDGASIVEAFQYYHTGGLTGSIFPDSIEQRLTDVNGRAATLETNLGYTGVSPTPSPVQTRLLSLETAVGGSLSSTYIKAIPSSNDTVSTRNLITPSASTVIPLTIQGVVGQSANLQEWKTSAATVARVSSIGKISSTSDGPTPGSTVFSEVTTLTGTQTLTNKTLTSPISTVGTNARTSSYPLVLLDQSKLIEIASSSGTTLGVPLNSNVAFPIGTYIVILQTGTGQITIDPAIGVGESVTVNATPGLKLRAQWSMATLIKRGTNLWVLAGDLSA